jgi:GAF domain-containing protein
VTKDLPVASEQRLAEALEQQTATAEILRVISSSPDDARPVFQAIVESAARLCEAEFSAVAQFSDGRLHLVALNNMSPAETTAYHSLFPRAPHRGFVIGRAFVDARPVHVEDVQQDPDYERRTLEVLQHAAPYRTFLGIPILRHGVPIGAIGCGRREVKPFTPSQIELVKTFADQAVIAIENVRLFQELEVRNRDLTETLEQQTATGQILRVISSSPTDIQPVFDTIVANAVTLCGARMGAAYRFDGELLHLVAHHNYPPRVLEVLQQMHPRPPQRDQASGRAILTCGVAQIENLLADPLYPREIAVAGGWRSILAVPMLREGKPIGAIVITRSEAGPFSDGHIELLKTFADQAVIAIENVRLFTELEVRNRDLTETLEQQTATGEILRAISSSPTDIQPVLDTIVRNAVRLCDGLFGAVGMLENGLIQLVAVHNYTPEVLDIARRMYPMAPHRNQLLGRAILDRSVAHLPDVQGDPEYASEVARLQLWRGGLAVPMIRDGVPIGAIFVARAQVGAFSDRQIDLLKTFAEQAVIAVENVRLFTEVEARNRELTETLEQQTATSEVLKVISRSAFDLQPVLETVIESATRLCGATRGHILRFDGELLRFAAAFGAWPEFREYLEQHPVSPGAGSIAGRAALERRLIHVPDVRTEPGYQYGELLNQQDYRTVLAVPMLRDHTLLGVIDPKSTVEPFWIARLSW